MGLGIAMVYANAGIPVLLKETSQEYLDHALATMRALYQNAIKHGRITPAQMEERVALITPCLTYDGFNSLDIVVEAVFEGIALKQQVFAELSRVCRADAILATNTSTLDIDEIASAATDPKRVIGTHFFTPPPATRLLEVIPGRLTSPAVTATAMQLSARLGKLGIVVGNCPGFIANRMSLPYFRTALFLIEDGATASAVDQALMGFGMSIGPMLVADLVGHDLIERIRSEDRRPVLPGTRIPFLESRMFHSGRLGRKSGAGWYRYDSAKHPSHDPDIDALARQWAAEENVPQRVITDEEIVERCVFSLINEGARIIEEGFVERVSDVDIVFVNGYGFPAWRGGPMWYADSIGLKTICQRSAEWHAAEGPGHDWTVAPLLQRLANEGKTFRQYAAETVERLRVDA
jgi:3-hydroxyacyl-CoA dehydrogenase